MKKTAFNDHWFYEGKEVTLPHDAMLCGGRSADAKSGSAGAFFLDGTYTYTKEFKRPEDAHVLLYFEAVYRNAKVYINEKYAGGTAYGYTSFYVNADEYLCEGMNRVRVECSVEHPDARWYTGAGILRPVWIFTGPADSIEPDSVRLSVKSLDPCVLYVRSPKEVEVAVGGVSGKGKKFEITVPDARLWSEDDPFLYEVRVSRGSDSDSFLYGIRMIEWSNKGLLVNGKNTLLRGGCIHHDGGILGAAIYDESELRRVKKIKEAGFNAIRSSHNPCSRALLEACDTLGVYLIDETWDQWFFHKVEKDYAREWKENYKTDLDALIRKDFNHPSVIMYSIGNELSEPAKEEGIRYFGEIAGYVRKEDPSRPVTAGMNLMIISRAAKGNGIYKEDGSGRDESDDKKVQGMNSTMFNLITSFIGTGMNKAANSKQADRTTSPTLDLLDICGYNYASGRYPLEKKAHPDRVIFGSETFPQSLAKNWAMVEKYPYLIGDFMWTAWDYLGEAGIGSWTDSEDGKGFNKPYPWLLAETGVYDILGNPNGERFWTSAIWGKPEAPVICVRPVSQSAKIYKSAWRGTNAIPSWSWPGCEGKTATVEVYYPCNHVELYLDGKKIGRAKSKECRAVCKVRYMPGELTAAAFSAEGRELGKCSLRSAEGPFEVWLRPEKEGVSPGEILYIPVEIADKNGVVVSSADRQVNLSVENGELLGFGSANPRNEESFLADTHTTYYGQALAVIRAGKSGAVTVRADEGTAVTVTIR